MDIIPFTPDLLSEPGTVRLVTIDRDGAKFLLGLNSHNRHIRPTTAARYRDAIDEGRWVLSPDAVAVENGVLINGQHRLRAIADTDQAVVVFLSVDTGVGFDVTDNGATRSAGDVLFLAGLSDYPGQLASAAKLYLRACGVSTSRAADNGFIEKFVIAHAELDTWVTWTIRERGSAPTRLAEHLWLPLCVTGYALDWAHRSGVEAPAYSKNMKSADIAPTGRPVGGSFGNPARWLTADERLLPVALYKTFAGSVLTGAVEAGSPEQALRDHVQRRLDRNADNARRHPVYGPLELLALIALAMNYRAAGSPGPAKFVVRDMAWEWRRPAGDLVTESL
jgi:hypothetical protein